MVLTLYVFLVHSCYIFDAHSFYLNPFMGLESISLQEKDYSYIGAEVNGSSNTDA